MTIKNIGNNRFMFNSHKPKVTIYFTKAQLINFTLHLFNDDVKTGDIEIDNPYDIALQLEKLKVPNSRGVNT